MSSKVFKCLLLDRAILVVAAILVSFALSDVMAAGDSATQTSRAGGIDVKATPRSLTREATVWEFEVAFDTHAGALSGDPAEFSTLVDSQGRIQPPLAWKGDPPGGHHRKGVLQFKPMAGATSVELRINGVGGVATRSFRWSIGVSK